MTSRDTIPNTTTVRMTLRDVLRKALNLVEHGDVVIMRAGSDYQVRLSGQGITPSNMLVMMLIDAVRDTTPPPYEVTIGMLTKILQALEPAQAVEAWAVRSSREIVSILSKRPEVRRVAELSDDERIWCTLEGVIAGMLLRVCRGQDLHTVDNTTGQQVPDLGLRPAESAAPAIAPGGPFPRTVTCAWCANRYVSAIPVDLDRGTCGCNCACDVRFRDGYWDIFCGYGSENDMDILRFVANPPNAPADPICDECIRERMLCGDIVRLDETLDPSKAPGLTELAQPTERDNRPPREATPAVGTVAALAANMVAAGGTLPYPGTVADVSVTPTDPRLNPQPHDRNLILKVIHDLDHRDIEQSAALRRLLERADDFLGWHVRDARVGRPT